MQVIYLNKTNKMIVTKEQQEKIVDEYVREKHNTDECIGFIDGINATIELINSQLIQIKEAVYSR